tara:strand:+ start:386 stop:631 length:246 start_codon:yes stop_codon:yes gene_type:complete
MAFAWAARRPSSWSVSSTLRDCSGALVADFEVCGGVFGAEFVKEEPIEVVWCLGVVVIGMTGDELEEALDELFHQSGLLRR